MTVAAATAVVRADGDALVACDPRGNRTLDGLCRSPRRLADPGATIAVESRTCRFDAVAGNI